VLKLSGETLSSGDGNCYDEARAQETARVILALQKRGVQLGIVMGGGNIWRGRFSREMDSVSADQMGMLATIMNALALAEAIVRLGGRASVFTAQEMNRFARLYTRDAALQSMEAGDVALLAGGTGNPFCTTDTAAALRAAELHADALLKGTKEEGLFDDDPRKNPNAKLIPEISYQEAFDRRLTVMDITAFEICRSQKIPQIRIFSMEDLNNILRVADGEGIGSTVHQ